MIFYWKQDRNYKTLHKHLDMYCERSNVFTRFQLVFESSFTFIFKPYVDLVHPSQFVSVIKLIGFHLYGFSRKCKQNLFGNCPILPDELVKYVSQVVIRLQDRFVELNKWKRNRWKLASLLDVFNFIICLTFSKWIVVPMYSKNPLKSAWNSSRWSTGNCKWKMWIRDVWIIILLRCLCVCN